MSYFLIISLGLVLFKFAVLGDWIPSDVLNTEQWVQISIFSVCLFISCLMVLLRTAYANSEMYIQMKQLQHIRDVYHRIIRDDKMIRCNPVTIPNRIQ